MGAGFPTPKATRPSTFGQPLSSSRLMSGVLAELSGSLNRPLQSHLGVAAQLQETLHPDLAFDAVTDGRTIGGKGQNRRQERSEDIQLQTRGEPPLIVEQLAVRARQQKPIPVGKDIGVVEKHRRQPPSGMEFPDIGSGEEQRLPTNSER